MSYVWKEIEPAQPLSETSRTDLGRRAPSTLR